MPIKANNPKAFSLAIAPKVVALTDAAPITIDASLGNVFTVTLAASRTLSNPTNATTGQKIVIRIKQGGSGSYTITWSSEYRFSTGLPQPTLSTAVNKEDYIAFLRNNDDSKWDCIGYVIGFN